jgi:hypothetical protein
MKGTPMFGSKWSTGFMLILLAIALAAPLHAQTESEMAVARSDMQAERQATVAVNLPLTEVESAAFWPLYREYRNEVAKLGDKQLKLIGDYAKAWNDASLTDEQAMDLVKDSLGQKEDAIDLKQKYLSKFGKILSGKTAARFYQIENKMDAMVAMGIADQIPLVEN